VLVNQTPKWVAEMNMTGWYAVPMVRKQLLVKQEAKLSLG